MALWGITTADESKPKYLTQEEKNRTIAKQDGWNLRTTIGARIQDEILVATTPGANGVNFLSTALAEATISAVHFAASTYEQTDAAKVVVVYNELVNVTGGETLVVTGSVTGAITATAAAQTGVNQVEFDFTVPSATETLSIGAQTITLNAGAVVDAAGGAASDIIIGAGDIIDAGGAGTGGTATIAVA